MRQMKKAATSVYKQGKQIKSKINSADKSALMREFQKLDQNEVNKRLKSLSKQDIMRIINGL